VTNGRWTPRDSTRNTHHSHNKNAFRIILVHAAVLHHHRSTHPQALSHDSFCIASFYFLLLRAFPFYFVGPAHCACILLCTFVALVHHVVLPASNSIREWSAPATKISIEERFCTRSQTRDLTRCLHNAREGSSSCARGLLLHHLLLHLQLSMHLTAALLECRRAALTSAAQRVVQRA